MSRLISELNGENPSGHGKISCTLAAAARLPSILVIERARLIVRILFVITRADTVGGAQVHVRDLAQALIRDRHQVLVVTGQAGDYTQTLIERGIPQTSIAHFGRAINPLPDVQTLWTLRQIMRTFQPDLVSTHSSKAGLLGRLASRFNRVPCLFTAHGWAFTPGVPARRRQLYRAIERLAEPWAAKIICVSEYDRQLGLQCGMSAHRLITVHNGMPQVANQYRAEPSRSEPVVMTMVARFDQQKDHGTLIRALVGVPGLQLNLIGDGPTLPTMQALVADLGLTSQVKFLGFRADIAACLAESQIFVLISHWEGFPRTIIEAMRAGLPVVATQVGGVAEAVLDGVTGFCIPPEDETMLRQRLQQLMQAASLRQDMGAAGRQRYQTQFTFERMYTETYQVYESVLSGSGATS
ncbi:glycosyltransferase family 4 protein [Halomicronema sp. CCY15110]|uniref:glycosyltransferase family 4 protein n=1 Tax=Halomicronema sp. CCY15110 TaxID=2767773 RepID=UPI001951A593|nr:glycosyltransferase family 4 protein [Halomicronema sp. CCY15110]